MKIKDTLKIIHTTYYGSDRPAIRLNMSMKDLFDMMGNPEPGCLEKLEDSGIEINEPVMASEQDVADFREFSTGFGRYREFDDKNTAEDVYAHRLIDELSVLVYYDTEIIDKATGKHGLVDSNGKMVVPALFDECKGCWDIESCESLAIVRDGVKYYLTPRDGSGRLINKEPYSEITGTVLFGWVKRGDRCGLIDMKTGKTLIPCEMDWIETISSGFIIIGGRNHYLGVYDAFLDKYIPQLYAYDFATKQFVYGDRWGWVRRSGRFTTKAPRNFCDIITLGTGIESVLNLSDKPQRESEIFFTSWEEVKAEGEKSIKRIKKDWERSPESCLELPQLNIPENIRADERMTAAINHSIGLLQNKEQYDLTIQFSTPTETGAPALCVSLNRREQNVFMKVIWSQQNRKLAWLDAQFDGIDSFHQIVCYGEKGLDLKFEREFEIDEAETVARFVAYYYSVVWHIDSSELEMKRTVPSEYVTPKGETIFDFLPLDDDDKIIPPKGCSVPSPNCISADQLLEELKDKIRLAKEKQTREDQTNR